LAQLPNLPRQLNNRQVLVRFVLRVIILTSFAAFGSIGFGRSLAALLWMAIILCVVVGVMRREPVFRTGLNHWDEAVAYAAIYALVTGVNEHLSS
jgi:hypothetical protein